ncbi:major facilitator superfamily transporter [Fusarium oxysporum f. sp. phaseoli]
MADKTSQLAVAETKLPPLPSKLGREETDSESIAVGENLQYRRVRVIPSATWIHNRKVDMVLLPLMAGTYVLQFIDKQALSYSAVFDLLEDTGTTLKQYSWFGSIFYLAYLVAEYPWSFLAQKTLMAKVVAGCIIAWGSIMMITAASTNFAGLAVCRFFLGIFEAPITPVFMMIVGMWYTRQEQPLRAGVFYSCNGIGLMLGGLLSFAIGQIEGFKVWECLMDPQIWLLIIFVLVNEVINGGVSNFGSLIIKGQVDDALLSVVLGIPQGAFQCFWILSGTWLASRYHNMRTVIMAVYNIPTMLGLCLIWKLDRESQKIGLLFGYYMVVLAAMLRYLLILRNRKRDHAATESVQAPEDTSADVTDFNNPHFRYVL